MIRKNIWWILIIAWCILIFFQSNKPAVESSMESSFIVDSVNNFISTFVGTGTKFISENFVRKTAHFIEYFILGCLLFNGLFNKLKLKKVFFSAWILATVYAITDEIHQNFVSGRAMRFFDVCVDSTGIFFGVFILFLIARKKYSKKT